MLTQRTWIRAIAAIGISIAVVAGWACFTYGNVLDQTLDRPNGGLLVGAVFLLALMGLLLRGVALLIRRWRQTDRATPPPGRWAFAWASFQLTCLLALLVLGVTAVVALPFGHASELFQAFMLVLVASALLFLTGGALRDFARVARSFSLTP